MPLQDLSKSRSWGIATIAPSRSRYHGWRIADRRVSGAVGKQRTSLSDASIWEAQSCNTLSVFWFFRNMPEARWRTGNVANSLFSSSQVVVSQDVTFVPPFDELNPSWQSGKVTFQPRQKIPAS